MAKAIEKQPGEQDEKEYQMRLGVSYRLLHDNVTITDGSRGIDYRQLRVANVQAIWHELQSNAALKEAEQVYVDTLHRILIEMGDRMNLSAGRITEDELKSLPPLV